MLQSSIIRSRAFFIKQTVRSIYTEPGGLYEEAHTESYEEAHAWSYAETHTIQYEEAHTEQYEEAHTEQYEEAHTQIYTTPIDAAKYLLAICS